MKILPLILVVSIGIVSCNSDQSQNKSSERDFVEYNISFDFWEGCETGRQECPELEFSRNTITDSVILSMPSSGTSTSVMLLNSKNEVVQKVAVSAPEYPKFNLTGLPDGKYFASMFGCNLGGTVTFNLNTEL
ncbi:MAG: hypothetical protein WDZ35_07840 [Crocinitomicaceae bacterium]